MRPRGRRLGALGAGVVVLGLGAGVLATATTDAHRAAFGWTGYAPLTEVAPACVVIGPLQLRFTQLAERSGASPLECRSQLDRNPGFPRRVARYR